jgi:CubicO group peptidase (beta-lactamase class C family)
MTTADAVAAMDEFESVALAQGFGIYGLVVRRGNDAAIERHWAPNIRRDVFSVSKTFTSVAIGIAEAEGLLAVDDPVLRHLPQFERTAAPGVEGITVRHLLTMTSGIVYRWADDDNDHPGEPAEDILSTPLGADPGSSFEYRGGNTYLLSRIIHACSGLDMRDFLLPRLFTPLGIRNPQWLRCPLGFSLGAIGLQLRTEEISRLAVALLHAGRFGDDQLVSPAYVASMSSDRHDIDGDAVRTTGYGRGIWIWGPDGAWRMDGLYGQLSVCLPRTKASVTVTAHYDSFDTGVIVDAIQSLIVPAL